MENKYLLSYLRNYYNDSRMNRILDYFKVDFDYYLYAYGCQFGAYDNMEAKLQYMYCDHKNSKTYINKWGRQTLINYIRHKAYLLYSRRIHKKMDNKSHNDESHKTVLFIEHVSLETRKIFAEKGIKIVCIEELNNKSAPDIFNIFEWYNNLSKLTFKERLELNRYDCLDDFIIAIQKRFRNYDGLFVGNDEYFICKLFIDAFKRMNIPTYNWSHGLDSSIGITMRTDYTLVWGNALKNNLVKDGKKEDSIIVSGNIHYFDIADISSFRNSLENVLVLTSATIANIRHTWDYDSFDKWDRSLLITYIYSVENVLKRLGVKRARLRPHPINNKLWVDKFIDTDFFCIDNLPLESSLENTSLAIGPTSSTFVESLRKGVTYLIYEPGVNGRNIIGTPLIPPFDGSDINIKVAFNEEQLKDLIEKHYSYDKNILKDYIVPFDIDAFYDTLGRKTNA